ncbi:hypothetical protein [Sulfurimonas sp. CS5]|uniref:hypothetical protein n=1 Tax=Sulfurimonas sp. CS5 TaxID=3391145 RepID=UPI0039EBEBA4
MFNEIKIKRLSFLLSIDDTALLQSALKRQAKYMKVSSILLLNSYITMLDVKKEYELNKLEVQKYKTKNLVIQKYKTEIVELYMQGMGYLKISNSLYLNHNTKVSKSSIENFIKKNSIQRADNG